jgi:peptidoglycan/LPS O-acetylase OafA/YrhL
MAEQRAGAVAGRAMFTLIGAAGLVIGAFLPWVRGIDGNRLALSALVRRPFVTEPNQLMTVGFVCVLLGLLAVVGLATSGWLTRLAGALGIVVFILLLIQLYGVQPSVLPGPGPWLVLAGGIVSVVGGG